MLNNRQMASALTKLVRGWQDCPLNELAVRVRAIALSATYHTLPVEVVTQWQLMLDKLTSQGTIKYQVKLPPGEYVADHQKEQA